MELAQRKRNTRLLSEEQELQELIDDLKKKTHQGAISKRHSDQIKKCCYNRQSNLLSI